MMTTVAKQIQGCQKTLRIGCNNVLSNVSVDALWIWVDFHSSHARPLPQEMHETIFCDSDTGIPTQTCYSTHYIESVIRITIVTHDSTLLYYKIRFMIQDSPTRYVSLEEKRRDAGARFYDAKCIRRPSEGIARIYFKMILPNQGSAQFNKRDFVVYKVEQSNQNL